MCRRGRRRGLVLTDDGLTEPQTPDRVALGAWADYWPAHGI